MAASYPINKDKDNLKIWFKVLVQDLIFWDFSIMTDISYAEPDMFWVKK